MKTIVADIEAKDLPFVAENIDDHYPAVIKIVVDEDVALYSGVGKGPWVAWMSDCGERMPMSVHLMAVETNDLVIIPMRGIKSMSFHWMSPEEE